MTIRQDKKNLAAYHRAQAEKIKGELDSDCPHDDTQTYTRTSGEGFYKMNIHTEHCEDCGQKVGSWNDKDSRGQ